MHTYVHKYTWIHVGTNTVHTGGAGSHYSLNNAMDNIIIV